MRLQEITRFSFEAYEAFNGFPELDTTLVETYEDVLYAIQNGGFSGAIMPQNIVVGEDAEQVARFVAEYSGQDVDAPPQPSPEPEGESAEETSSGDE